MNAFYKHGDNLIKVYIEGQDIKSVCNDSSEYWFSVWSDNVKGSLDNAIKNHCERSQIMYIPSFTEYV